MNAFRHMTRILVVATAALAGLAVTIPHARACPETGNSCCSACGEQPPVELCVPKADACGEESSSAPVRYLDGVLKYKSPGLHVDGPGRGFSISLGFNNRPHGVLDTDFNCGVNWWLQGIPFLEQRPDGTIVAIWGSTSVAEFAQSGNQWVGRHGVKAGIVSAVDDDQENVLVMQGVYGTKAYFHRLDADPAQRGKIKRIVTPGGEELSFTHGLAGVLTITDTNEYVWEFEYGAGLLTAVTVVDPRVDPLPVDDVVLTRMELEYYTVGARWGLSRDLRSVTVFEYTSDGSAVSKTAYYAYYTDSGRAHRLRFILDPENYAFVSENGTIDLDVAYVEAADFQAVADYEIDYSYELGPDRFCVSTENVRSAGCDCGTGRDTGVFRYAYTFQAENPLAPYNSWVTQVEQTNPDDTKKIVRVNKIGAPIDVITEVAQTGQTTRRWGMRYGYDSTSGALTSRAYPKVCVVDANRQITTQNGGLVETFTYEPTWGALWYHNVKNGMGGTPAPLEIYTYKTDYPRVESVSTLVDRNPLLPLQRSVVSYDYEYYTNDLNPANDAQVRLKTTTPPTVGATENGSDAPGQIRECFHPRTGRLLWREEMLAADTYRVVAYRYGDPSVSSEEEGLLYKQVSDPSTATWNAMKAAMGLDGSVDPPNTTANGADAATEWTYDVYRRVLTVTGPEVQTLAGPQRPAAHSWHTMLANGHRVTLSCAHIASGAYGAPVSVTVYDRDGRQVTRAMGVPSPNANDGNLANDIVPTATTLEGAFAGQLYERRSWLYAGGQVVQEDVWQDAEDPDANGTHYKTVFEYANGMLTRRFDPDGTVLNWSKVYDFAEWGDGYYVEESTGDTGQSVPTARRRYDFTAGDLDNPGIVREFVYVDDLHTVTYTHGYDLQNRRSTSKLESKDRVTRFSYDWAGRVIAEEQSYDNDGDLYYRSDSGPNDRRIAKTETFYDLAGRVYRTVEWEGDTAAAKTTNPRTNETWHWYDLAGNTIKTRAPTGLFQKATYDRLGRAVARYVSYDDDETSYTEACNRTGDIVLEEATSSFDDAGNETSTTALSRYHDYTQTGDLAGETNARPSYKSMWHDVFGRLVRLEDRGSTDSANGALVAQWSYAPDTGRLLQTTDPKGMVTQFSFDNLGRQTKIIRNYLDPGQINGDDHDGNQTIQLVYGAAGQTHEPFRVIERWTTDTLGGSTKTQKTRYRYGVPKGASPPGSCSTRSGMRIRVPARRTTGTMPPMRRTRRRLHTTARGV